MSCHISEFVSEAKSCSTAQELWAAYNGFTAKNNIEAWRYLYLPPFEEAPQCLTVSTQGINGGVTTIYKMEPLPETFLPESQRVIKKSLRRLERVETLAALSSLQDVRPEIQSQLTELLGQGGPEHMLLLPVLAARGYNGCFSLSANSKAFDAIENESSLLMLASQTAHQIFQTRFAPKRLKPTTLSPRETQILDGLARGLSNFDIAKELAISPHTVNGYLQRIFLKVDCNDRTTAVLTGLAEGLIH